MKAKEIELLNKLKAKIEDIAGLGDSSEWKQRDFLNLIDQIHQASGILLSLSTIRRIWIKYHSYTPHTSTLDALAIFAGYKNYHDFRISTETEEKEVHPPIKSVKWQWRKTVFFSLAVLVILIVIIVSPLLKTVELSFSDSSRIIDSIPATIYFPVKSKGIKSEEIYFQPNSRTDMKLPVDMLKGLNYRYIFPGFYQPVLWYGNRACDTTEVLLRTSGWNSYIISYDQDDKPAIRKILAEEMIRQNGYLGVDESFYRKNKIKIDGSLFTQYYFVSNAFNIDANNFIFEIRLKSDSIFNYPYPQFHIGLLIDEDVAYAGFGGEDFARDNDLRFGDTYLKGNTTDLSQLACNVYNWQNITFSNNNKEVTILKDTLEIYKLTYTTDINTLYGFNISFLGSGRIESLSLKSRDDEIIYKETFSEH